MSEKPKKQERLSLEELEAQNVERLPDREEMSLVDVNVAIPFNTAISAEVLPEDQTDEQDTTEQSNG